MRRFHLSISPEARAAVNLTAVQGLFWFAWSFGSYQTVYLQSNGMSAANVGAINAISSTVAIIAMTFWGMVSDKMNSIKKTLLIALVAGTAMYAMIPFLPTGVPYTTLLFFLYVPLVNFSRCSHATLLDNITVRNCSEKRLNYGIIRAFGSFTFTIGSLIIVALIPFVGIGTSFWLSSLLMIPAVVFLLFTSDPKSGIITAKGTKVSPGELFKNYYYVAFLIFSMILYIPLSGEASFLTYLMEDTGIPTASYGTVLAVRAIMEVPFLIIIVKLRRKFKLKYMIMAACTFMALECLYLGFFAGALSDILIGGVLFGLGNGIFLGTVSLYLYKLAPAHLKATAQTIFAAVTSVAGIAGNLAGGFSYQALGGRLFYIVLGCIILFSVAVFAVSFIIKKGLPNPADTLD